MINEKKPGRPRTHETSLEQEEQIVATYEQLMSRRKTALALSLPESVVQRTLREHKISMPKRGRPKEFTDDASGRLLTWRAHLNDISYDQAAEELGTEIYRARASVYHYKASLKPTLQLLLTRHNTMKKSADVVRSMASSKLQYQFLTLEFDEKNLTKK